MEIIVGKTAGFCMGITRAINITNAELSKNQKEVTYCLGELTHNPQVMENLSKNGLKVIENLSEIPNPKGKKVIFRAHGVTKEVYEEAEKLGLDIIDATCVKVLAIHEIIKKYAEEGLPIFLIGEKIHPEVIGTASFCGKQYEVIETEEDLQKAIEKYKKMNIKKLLVISQTTFNLEKFEKYVDIIKNELETNIPNIQIDIKNTICQATRIRQEETENLSKTVDAMIVIGGRKSSNTNKLYDIASRNCNKTIRIETPEELTNDILETLKNCSKVGIMAGASTPNESITKVREELEKI